MKKVTATLHFTELLLALIKGNTSLVDSLHILSGEGMEKPVKDTAEALLLLMKKGRGFSDSLRLIQDKKVYFNQMYISLISAAELTGKIDNVLERIAGDLRRRQQATENALNIMMYPLIIILVAITGTVFLIIKGMPFFISGGFLSGEILTNAVTGIIIAGLILLLGGAALFITYYRIFYFDSPEYRIFYVLDLLLKSNVPLLDAITQCITDMSGTKYGISLITIKKEVTGGISFSQAFGKLPYLSPYVTGWLAVADMHGNINEVCSNIKDFYAYKNTRRREALTRLIEPAVIVLTGSYLLTLIIAVVLPILTYAGGVL
ncbi:MAG: type II secretion system F family protein [Treponema sp.]|nr:type II secretion system F family protein [Treponema sp.]MCL2272296.1 type II secretion system F family protein [Treponema sp.]